MSRTRNRYGIPKMADVIDIVRFQSEASMRDLTDNAAHYMQDVVKRNTPVEGFMKQVAYRDASGRYVTVDASHLRDEIDLKVFRVYTDDRGRTVYESGAETNVSYAPYVEEGTGLWGPQHAKYEITPRKPGGWLSWITQTGFTRKDGTFVPPGTRVFAKKVMHPGSPGQHMFAIGASMTESEFEVRIAPPVMSEWENKIDARIERL